MMHKGLLALAALGMAVPLSAGAAAEAGETAAIAGDEDEVAADLGEGGASYFDREMAGNRTASGERCDPDTLTAAHRTVPLGSRLRVTSLSTGRQVVVRVNDRGPFRGGRVIDLSRAAADVLALTRMGHGRVRLELLR